MGDARFDRPYDRIRQSGDPRSVLPRLTDEEVVSALAAASRDADPYLANVLATEAHNRLLRSSAIAEHLAEGVVLLDAQGRVAFANPAFERIVGLDAGHLRGRTLDVLAPVRDEGSPIPVDVVLGTGLTTRGQVDLRRGEGVFPAAYTISPIRRDEDLVGAVMVLADITAFVQAAKRRHLRGALAELLDQPGDLVAAAPALLRTIGNVFGWPLGALWRMEPDGRLACAAFWRDEKIPELERFERASRGIRFERGVGLPGRVWVTGEVAWVADTRRDPSFRRAEAGAQAGIRSAVAFPIRRGNAIVAIIEFFSRDAPLAPEEDLMEAILTIVREVEDHLERSEADAHRRHLAAIVETSHDAIFSFSPEGRILTWNPAATRLLGWAAEEARELGLAALVPDEKLPEQAAMLAQVFAGQPLQDVEMEMLDRQGRPVPLAVNATPVRDPRGLILAAAYVARDVTLERQAHAALLQSEARFRSLLESAPDAMVIVDEQGRVALINAQAEELFGYPRDELVGQPVEKLVPDRSRASHRHDRASYMGHPHARPMGGGLDLHALHKDGTEIPVEISLSPTRQEGETFVTAAIRDLRKYPKRWTHGASPNPPEPRDEPVTERRAGREGHRLHP